MSEKWEDIGIVIGTRKYADHDLIVTILTQDHGRHLGLIKGGRGRKMRGGIQPGNILQAKWRARLNEHLGSYVCEPQELFAPEIMLCKIKLIELGSLCAMLNLVLPEREPHKFIYDLTYHLIKNLGSNTWYAEYVICEHLLLKALGFGLDLVSCAATGQTEELIYVSPKSARAVSKQGGAAYKDRLLPLPNFLKTQHCHDIPTDDILNGLKLTGYFLSQNLLQPYNKKLPAGRENLINLISN